jgi:integrase
LDEQTLCLVAAEYANSHKITTLPGFISALAHYAKLAFQQDLPRGDLYQRTLAGITNYYGDTNVSQHKTAVTLVDLAAFHRVLNTAYFEHARDWCACLLAFFGLLRVNEYMGSGLRMRHVCMETYGVELSISSSKTSRVATTVTLSSRPDHLCPRQALCAYLAFFPDLRLPHRPDDPLFITRMLDGRSVPMTDSDFISRLREIITAALPGRDPMQYAGHSFRRGGASALQEAGVPAALIQRHGRWTSDVFRIYLDSANSSAMRLLATQALLPPPAHPASSSPPCARGL